VPAPEVTVAAPAAPQSTVAADIAEAPPMKAIYRQAYDRARKELTPDTAGRRLEDLDGQIEREREMIR
jgi:hypothetical protein